MKLKQFLSCLLVAGLIGRAAFAQTVLFRQAGASLQDYRSLLQGSSFRITPMQALATRLKNDELPLSLQRELDGLLAVAAQSPGQSQELFDAFRRKLEGEPRSQAVRDTLLALLERMLPGAGPESQEDLQKHLDLLRRLQDQPTNPRLQASLLQKEIQERLLQLRRIPGGEDLTLYWNGLPWDEKQEPEAAQDSQWIFLSSQWRPRLLRGPWPEISKRLDEGFQDWIPADCGAALDPENIFIAESRREILFSPDCEKARPTGEPAGPAPWKTPVAPGKTLSPWILGGAAATAFFVFLSVSGKHLQIRR